MSSSDLELLDAPRTYASAGSEAELVASLLREHVARLLMARVKDTAMLERLHQDVVQVYTAGRLKLDLASLRLARDADVEELVRDGLHALARFQRLARAWRMLSPIESWQEQTSASDALLLDVMDLLHTEAAVRGVSLRLGAAPDGRPVAPAGRIVRALVRRTTAALARARRGGAVTVSATPAASVTWAISTARGATTSIRYDMAKGPSWAHGF